MNYTFIGMPGAGKSCVGKRVADARNMEFVDIDTIAEEIYKKPLQQIVNNLGDEEFLSMQEKIVLELGIYDNTVVSPGGSVVYSPDAMQFLKNTSTIVYLDVSIETLKSRIQESSRGIIGISDKTFEELYEERTKLYRQWADITIHEEDEALQILV